MCANSANNQESNTGSFTSPGQLCDLYEFILDLLTNAVSFLLKRIWVLNLRSKISFHLAFPFQSENISIFLIRKLIEFH